MRTCSYCGADLQDDVIECPIDHTPLVADSIAAAASGPSPDQPTYQFAPLSPQDSQKDFVTLVTCETLGSADMIVSRLRSAGIAAFIPDEYLMQTIGFNLNTFGYVRIQTTPRDYERARALLEDRKSQV